MSERPDLPNIIPVTPVDAPAPEGIARRAVLQTLLGGVGAGLALPSAADAQHPVQHHLASATGVAQAQKKAAVAAYQGRFFDALHSARGGGCREAIVPGIDGGQVAPRPRSMIAVESAQTSGRSPGASAPSNGASRSTARRGADHRRGPGWLLQEASTTEPAKSEAARNPFQNLRAGFAGA